MDQTLFGEKFSHHEGDIDMDLEEHVQEKQGLNGLFNKSHLTWNLLPVNPRPRHLKSQHWIVWKKSFVILQDTWE